MFGVSFGEVLLIAAVALVVVGPRRIPEIMNQLGQWIARLRRMTTEVRRQTGIDEILRAEGVAGGIAELRSMMRGDFGAASRFGGAGTPYTPPEPPGGVVDAYGDAVEFDRSREYPVEGPDAYGAIPEDLVRGALPAESTPLVPTLDGSVAPPRDPA